MGEKMKNALLLTSTSGEIIEMNSRMLKDMYQSCSLTFITCSLFTKSLPLSPISLLLQLHSVGQSYKVTEKLFLSFVLLHIVVRTARQNWSHIVGLSEKKNFVREKGNCVRVRNFGKEEEINHVGRSNEEKRKDKFVTSFVMTSAKAHLTFF